MVFVGNLQHYFGCGGATLARWPLLFHLDRVRCPEKRTARLLLKKMTALLAPSENKGKRENKRKEKNEERLKFSLAKKGIPDVEWSFEQISCINDEGLCVCLPGW